MPNFDTWWSSRTHQIAGVPQTLPQAVPLESTVVQAIYDSFLLHFRAFEAWHLNERSRSLKSKYEGSLEAIYMDLRPDPRPGVQTLWKEEHYTILAVDAESQQVHLDKDVQQHGDSVWLHDQHMLNVITHSGDICTVSSSEHLMVGDEVTQRIFLTGVSDILQAFEAHWTPRWSILAQIPPADWQRIVDFAGHYMPSFNFQWEELSLPSWRAMIRKFKRKAARGPDGFSGEDLKHMPDGYAQPLLDLLQSIEQEDTAWPQQLAFGTVIGLSKQDGAHEEGHFRSITLFPTIYRAWARLRTKQMILQMSKYIPPEALGFLPQRETTEVWMMLQAQIELMVQMHMDYAGLSTDLKRAFNHIGRNQVFLIARHVGLPHQLLRPWQKFLNNFVRRFDVHGCLGTALTSSSGFPEGCPLSILAMLIVNWCYHIYMRAFCPTVVAYSFVDNLTLAARDALAVIHAFFALQSVCLLFGLMTDASKTYVWALSKSSRALIGQLGFECVTDASELGGAMTFGRSRRTRLLRQRGSNLHARWTKLRRSQAPGPQKMSVLSKVFWPQALHGSANCLIAETYPMELRREATKALGINGAGVNPVLRLSLADDMRSDPSYYQLHLCLSTFRRMLQKSPDLLTMWRIWMSNYDGHLIPGPFSKLMQCFQMIGWSVIDPPMVADHEGLSWNLMYLDNKTLNTVLEDAWLQYVAAGVRHKTMSDLRGMDGFLTKLGSTKLSTLDRARLAALHSGAFISRYEHSKYDTEKTPMCALCQLEDDRLHWLVCPRFHHIRCSIPDWCPDNVELPRCTLQHLLVPRQDVMTEWRALLSAPEEDGISFFVPAPTTGFQHLFLDGSCIQDLFPVLNRAAWGVVSATMEQVVAMSHLKGVTQTIDRAELIALIAALHWTSGTELEVCLWSDSQSTIAVAEFIQRHHMLPDGVENADLWVQVLDLLQDRGTLFTGFRWIPSHLPAEVAEDSFEEWVIKWNDAADRLAVFANTARPLEQRHCLVRAQAILSGWAKRLRQLQQFYFQVAEFTGDEEALPDHVSVVSSESENDGLWFSWADSLPINWKVQCQHGGKKVPGDFLVSVVEWVCAAERLEGTVREINEVELVFAFFLDREFKFPFSIDGSLKLCMRCPDSLFQQPTLAMMLRPVQYALAELHKLFPHVVMQTVPLNRVSLGLYKKFAGLRIHIPDDLWSLVQSRVQSFTATRAVRRACDLARPA